VSSVKTCIRWIREINGARSVSISDCRPKTVLCQDHFRAWWPWRLKSSPQCHLTKMILEIDAESSVSLKLRPFDPEWTLPSMMDKNPLVWMAEVNGC
jgi:hypothetical protein